MTGKYYLHWLTVCLFCPLTGQANSETSPTLQMHIFEENADNPSLIHKPVNGGGQNRPMQMVVFNEPPETQNPGGGLSVNDDHESAIQKDQVATNQTENGGTQTKAMQMVVFSQALETQNPASQLPADHDRDISISADNQVTAVTQQAKGNDLDETDYQMEYYLNAGYQHNNFDWNIAYPTGYPNIVSELKWNDIESAMFESGMNVTYDESWYADVKLGYGEVMGGSNQDSDFYLNNRQGEFSRSNNASDDGYLFDASGALGYHVNIRNKNATPIIRLTPKVGYSYHSQQFNMTDGFQVIDTRYGYYGIIPGLDSTYDASWHGFWSGFETRFLVSERFSLRSSFQYHWMDYYGKGNWNLRDDFQHPKSFTQSADGDGIVTSASAQYLFTPDWAITLNLNYQEWNAENDGIHKFYFWDGDIVETKFNQMNSYSFGVNMGVEYRF